VCRAHGRGGPRQVALADFHRLPGARPDLETALDRGEIITEVWLPKSVFKQRSAYVKVRDRASFAFALASAAVALELDGSRIKQARVALGGVATKPWRAEKVEQALIGKAAVRETFVLASNLAMEDAQTTPQNAFKVELGKRCVQRALETVGAGT
jgi:xanthine dehydrogenase YagS FAD-binding subunit